MAQGANRAASPMESAGPRLPAVDRAIRGLMTAGIGWTLLRGEIDGPAVGEIDLLVARRDASGLDEMLAEAGFARIPVWGHAPHRFFVAYEATADRWVKLDVVTRIEFRTGHIIANEVTDAVLARRSDADGVMRLPAADHFWLLLLHCLLDRRLVRETDLAELHRLSTRGVTEGPVHRLLGAGAPARAMAIELVERGDAAGLVGLVTALSDCLERAGAASRVGRRLARAGTPLMKAVRRPGVTVALLGPDGAGKSTLIRSLAETFYYPARTYYLGLYGARRPRQGRAARLPGMELGSQLMRVWRGYALAAWHRRRGRLVLFDRHGYEALLPARGRPSWKRRLRRLLVGRLSPAPDLVLVLDAPPDLLHARKHEHDRDALAAQRAAYRRLAAWLEARGQGTLLDARGSASTVRRNATVLIWRHVAQRR